MSLQDIALYSGGGLLLLLTFVQISPIKIHPWRWMARCIGRALHKDLFAKIDAIDQKVVSLEEKSDERNADSCRSQILRFGDEILHGVPHSKEHYDDILRLITEYENYCADHPKYMNNVAVATIKHIKHMYQRHLEEDSFLK